MFKNLRRWHFWLVLVVVMIAALVPVFPLLHASSQKAHASGGSATITLSSPTGQPGTTVQVSGQGFVASMNVAIYWNETNGTPLAFASSDAAGNLPATDITIPDQPSGSYSIIAVQVSQSITAKVSFSVVPLFSLSSTNLYPGESVIFTGKGFSSYGALGGDSIGFFLDTTTSSYFTNIFTSENGDFSFTATLPASSIAQGAHTIIAKSFATQLTKSVPVTFTPHLFPIIAKPAMSVQLTGAAFAANETVNVYWGTAAGQLEGTPTTDATGNLTFTFTAPAGLQPGAYPITVVRSHQKPARVAALFQVIPLTLTTKPGIHSGEAIKLHGTGFLPFEGVTISWDANGGQQVASTWTDGKGAFQTQVIPPSAPPGTYVLTVVGANSGLQATTNLSIGPGISSAYGDPGGIVNIQGGGFSANETLNVYFQQKSNGEISVTTDATGSFNVQLTVPSTYDPTVHYFVYAVSAVNTEHARAPFTFYTPGFIVSDATYQQPVTFNGANFAVNEKVDLIWNYQQGGQYTIGVIQASSWGGSFMDTIPAPSTPNQSSIPVAAVGETSHLVVTATIQNSAAIYLSPNTGKAGAKVTVTGGSFGSSSSILLLFQGMLLLGVVITSKVDGSFTGTFKVPTVAGAGNITVEASDEVTQSNFISATAPFTYTPVVKVSPGIVHSGDTLLVTGKHFTANSSVQLSINGHSLNLSPYTDLNGAFSISIPAQGQTGTNYLYAASWASQIFVSAAFVIE